MNYYKKNLIATIILVSVAGLVDALLCYFLRFDITIIENGKLFLMDGPLNLYFTIMGGIATTLFLGGWMPLHIPGWEAFNTIMDYIPSIIWFLGKSIVVVWISMWFRWTFPRLRIDQLLKLEWKYLLPISLVNLVIMSVIVVLGWHF